MASALDGFTWSPIKQYPVPANERMCVHQALGNMMGWAPDSAELMSIPVGPDVVDLKRLCEEKPQLGLRFHGSGATVPGGQRGIVIGWVPAPFDEGRAGHAEYAGEVGSLLDKFVLGVVGVITFAADDPTPQ